MGGSATRHKRFSLKWGLAATILGCWLLPISVIIGMMGYFISHSLLRQIDTTIIRSVDNAVEVSGYRIEAAIASSRGASYNTEIRETYRYYTAFGGPVSLYDDVTAYLTQQYKYNENLLATLLFFTDNPDVIYYTDRGGVNTTYDATVTRYKSDIHEQVKRLYPGIDTGIAFVSMDGDVYMVRNLLNSRFKPYAVLVMKLDMDVMFGALQKVLWGTRGTIWLNGVRIPLSGGGVDAEAAVAEVGTRLVKDKAHGDTVASGCIEGDGYVFAYALGVDSYALMNEFSNFRFVLLGLLLLGLPLLALVIAFFYHNVSRPIGGLIAAARGVEQGKFGIQISGPCANREFQYLFNSFNSMSSKLKYQFERIYREELALRDAQIMALQSQINPHFLGNTLEIINWEARLAGDVKVSRMIESLSTMLDAAMDRRGKPTVHLSEEMMYVDAYLYIIAERLGKRLVVKEEIDPAVLDLQVPRLVMQPIIENAVEHGVQPKQGGEIIIRAFREGAGLVLEVENDGEMTREDERRVEELLSSDYDASHENSYSLGIRNVNQRLRILYGAGCGLSIKVNSKGRAVARIIIAVPHDEQ